MPNIQTTLILTNGTLIDCVKMEPVIGTSVVIENGESGGSVAGPVAVAVLNSLVKND